MVPSQALRNLPWWTVGLGVAMVVVLLTPGISQWLIFDRRAIAGGEYWRLLTGHLVHYSWAHLINNLLVLGLAGVLVEARDRSCLPWITLVSALTIGAGIYRFEPGIDRYAGASGVALALLTYALLCGLQERTRWRLACAVALAIVSLKLLAENLLGWYWIDWQVRGGFVSVGLSHVTGACSGLLAWLVQRSGQWCRRRQQARQVPL